MIDGEESDRESKPETKPEPYVPPRKEPEVIGHRQDSGELVVVVKGKGRGRPKGECALPSEAGALRVAAQGARGHQPPPGLG